MKQREKGVMHEYPKFVEPVDAGKRGRDVVQVKRGKKGGKTVLIAQLGKRSATGMDWEKKDRCPAGRRKKRAMDHDQDKENKMTLKSSGEEKRERRANRTPRREGKVSYRRQS